MSAVKTLLLMRHAKSSWKQEGLADYDRPLKGRGERDATKIGRALSAADIEPELILTSAARRALQTAQHVESEILGARVEATPDLYGAGPDELLRAAAGLPDGLSVVMLLAHNPGLEEWLADLTDEVTSFPTGGVAQVELPIDRWSDLDEGVSGRLRRFLRPRELAE
jgi:phosphohistidine phosphatase